jgi:hypothetical protein
MAEISPNHCQSVSNSIAFLVKLFCRKLIVAGSVQQTNLFNGLVKKLHDGGFFFKRTNYSREFHKVCFFSEKLGNGLIDELVELHFPQIQLSSQVCNLLGSFWRLILLQELA